MECLQFIPHPSNSADVSRLRDELRNERDRLQLLLDVTQAVVSHLDLRGLFRAIAAGLRRVVPAEYVSLALYDPVRHGWDLHALDFPSSKGYLRESIRVPFDAAPASLAFTARKPASLDREGLAKLASHSSVARALIDEGIRHWCCVPVLGRERVLGTINMGREADLAFGQSEIEWLQRVAGPVGLAVENALAYAQIEELKNKLAAEKTYLEDEIRTEYGFAEIIGNNSGLRSVLSQVEIVAPADTTVLILGETGTGKELIARAIHRLSKRAERTFVKLNCAAIPTGLMESELFASAFVKPLEKHRGHVASFIFEFGTFTRKEFAGVDDFLPLLDRFLANLPNGWRYAVEIRNRDFLGANYFSVLSKHNVAHVFNAWTRMPLVSEQISMPGAFTADHVVVRALLQHGRTYESAVATFEPYEKIQQPDLSTREAIRQIARVAVKEKKKAYLFVNNRLEGNAPGTIAAIAADGLTD